MTFLRRDLCLAPYPDPDLEVDIAGYTLTKRDVALVVTYLDLVFVTVFLASVVWLRGKERAAMAENEEITAGEASRALSP